MESPESLSEPRRRRLSQSPRPGPAGRARVPRFKASSLGSLRLAPWPHWQLEVTDSEYRHSDRRDTAARATVTVTVTAAAGRATRAAGATPLTQ